MSKSIWIAAAASIGLLAFGSAKADWVGCGAYASANGPAGYDDCTTSTDLNQDNTNPPLVVNSGTNTYRTPDPYGNTGAFGGGWEFIQKIEGGAGIGPSGTYDFGAAMYDEYMLVFKDGAGTFLTGYLVSTLSGTWTTPFQVCVNDRCQVKDNSHLSYYGRGEPPLDMPEPGTLALLGLGLAGLGFGARRRQKA